MQPSPASGLAAPNATNGSSNKMSFAELRALMVSVSQNESLYKQHLGQVYVVSSMKQAHPHHHFNVEKAKKRKKKGEKKVRR